MIFQSCKILQNWFPLEKGMDRVSDNNSSVVLNMTFFIPLCIVLWHSLCLFAFALPCLAALFGLVFIGLLPAAPLACPCSCKSFFLCLCLPLYPSFLPLYLIHYPLPLYCLVFVFIYLCTLCIELGTLFSLSICLLPFALYILFILPLHTHWWFVILVFLITAMSSGGRDIHFQGFSIMNLLRHKDNLTELEFSINHRSKGFLLPLKSIFKRRTFRPAPGTDR